MNLTEGQLPRRSGLRRSLRYVLLFVASGIAAGCDQVLGLDDHTLAPPDGGSAHGGGSAGGGDGGSGGAGAAGQCTHSGSGGALPYNLTVAADTDDAVWGKVDGSVIERLSWPGDNLIQVSTDADQQRAGFRFGLDIPRCSTIHSAVLTLERRQGQNEASDTIRIQIFAAPDVPPFDGTHVHGPEGHAPGGLLGQPVVDDFMPTKNVGPTTTPDLSALVQHFVDEPGFKPGNHIGFVLLPQSLTGYVAFEDTAAGNGNIARLELTYTPGG